MGGGGGVEHDGRYGRPPKNQLSYITPPKKQITQISDIKDIGTPIPLALV